MSEILRVENLSVAFKHKGASDAMDEKVVVNAVSFALNRGETLALVGESGSGKSVTALSILRLLPYPQATHPSGSIIFDTKDLMKCSESDMRAIRGRRISMIFQEPMTSLNPLHTIQKQIAEILILHQNLSNQQVDRRVVELLDMVGFPDGAKRLNAYPHELSGGQRQRVMIAMALASNPDILIADEPTTALDVTTQAMILDILKDLQKKLDLSILLITHDLGIVRKMAHQVCVMRQGILVEEGETESLFKNPQDQYTQHLIASEPSGHGVPLKGDSQRILGVKDLKVHFPVKSGFWRRAKSFVKAVDGVSFDLQKGSTLGIVGESGSGKSTIAQALLRLVSSEGEIILNHKKIHTFSGKAMRPMRRHIQIVFQDPFGSLSPRMSIAQIIGEGLDIHFPELSDGQRADKIAQALRDVSLDPDSLNRYPHEFSGGQRQRIAIARALILDPEVLILDEPTSALDRSIQVEILNLLKTIQKQKGLSFIFISHDLKVVRSISHRIMVLEKGRVVEFDDTETLFKSPTQAYTKLLIHSAMD